ncbi:MAG: nucleoside triphosphate pyrophosphohydrolase [Anaerolineae bacterium UTCFX2]|mgnify:CR=1 FL=1|jgi:tetrapyrrole methylase family protein/MazG family protein|nr:nucleoside triphosphate pyrophosphohydrolase [Anaerolineales bacterium]OQY94491.1 MAG: nucleoside triphosphate pyrophosphohydrolase [Anaerolineae bacterium UTCFX2]
MNAGGIGIRILGLGPGGGELLTRKAWQVLHDSQEIYLRTRLHPAVEELPAHLVIHSFDDLYETEGSFEQVYAQITERIVELGRRETGVVYAVPGHPLVAEATTPQIMQRAAAEGLPVEIIDGMSFLEPVLTALGIDPFPQTVLVDALEIAGGHVPPFPTSTPALIAQIYSKTIASNVKLVLTTLYPDNHPVRLVHAAGTARQVVEDLKLYEIDRSNHLGLLSALFLPPLPRETSFEAFLEVVAHLRSPEGCPWDREQTHQSLKADLLEETYEALAAMDADDPEGMCEELGDMILLILLHTQIAADNGEFTIADVLQRVHTKIVRRHPHVFGDQRINDEKEVLQNWEKLKEQERQESGNTKGSLLDGVALALPALVQSQIYQKRAARVGFDWPDVQGVLDKLNEELDEVIRAANDEERASEIGDLLFAMVNLARWYDIDAESALRLASGRFRERFAYIEQAAHEQGCSVSDLTLDEMEALWQQAKKL